MINDQPNLRRKLVIVGDGACGKVGTVDDAVCALACEPDSSADAAVRIFFLFPSFYPFHRHVF